MASRTIPSNNSWWKQKLFDLFGIDPRSLAVFRIGIALVVLWDLVDRIGDFDAMYRDSGILSVADAKAHYNPATWSLYFLYSADWYQALLMGLTLLSCLLLLLGCFTRLATLATWILLISLHSRMPLVLNSGDNWLRLMLFWSIFLPLGHVWSVDARRAGRSLVRASLKPVLSVASAGALCQIALVYFFAGLSKWNEAWLSGDAMYYVYDQLIFVRPLARALLKYPWICQFLSYATVGFELLAPLLMFVPWGTRFIRIAVVMIVFSFHVGIELTLNVGHFSYIAFSAWLLFLPAMFWESKIVPAFARGGTPDRDLKTSHGLISPPPAGRVTTIFCACILAFVLIYNATWIGGWKDGEAVRDVMKPAGFQLRLTQNWRMFGIPFNIDPWCVYRARLRNGDIVDLIRDGQNPSDLRPDKVPSLFWNHRWNKMHQSMALDTGENPEQLQKYRQRIAEYVCRRWNREHGREEQIVKLEVLLFGTEIGPAAKRHEFPQGTFATVEFAQQDEISEFQEELLRIESGEDPFSKY